MGTEPTPPSFPAPLAPPQAGQTLGGKWHLDAVLGTGAMATVFEAHHRNGKRVAIKILHPEVALDEHALGRFQREGYLANAVDHPGVVSVLDEGISDEGLPFLVMEFLEGESLGARLSRLGQPLNVEDALAIGVAVLEALAAAHERGLVHRDLKPDNIFLCTNGTVKILDFGIARLREMPLGVTTRNGLMLGTLAFMAREQALGRTDLVDTRSDLYSVTATLITALTRKHVFEAPNMNQMLVRLVTREPPPVSELVPGIPAPLAEVLDRGLAHDQAKRWQTASEMREALLVAALESGVDVPERPSQVGYTPPPREQRPLEDLLASVQVPSVPLPPPSRRSGNTSIALDATPPEHPSIEPPEATPSAPLPVASARPSGPSGVPASRPSGPSDVPAARASGPSGVPAARASGPSGVPPSGPSGPLAEPATSLPHVTLESAAEVRSASEPSEPSSSSGVLAVSPRATGASPVPAERRGRSAVIAVAMLAAVLLGFGLVFWRPGGRATPALAPAASASAPEPEPAAAASSAPSAEASTAAPAASSAPKQKLGPGKRRGPRGGDLGATRQ